ncbi:cell division protein FtsL [Paenibacillus oenotherae]|uniref:Cell division protein FtsL n=1 Tax=Paenibacillus oenotherae TaxID=1435645 RepID=A0ABS7D1B6_9BACL|nr:cell division protein FtsL [Paenibacillus oenotherae]MBW7473656.1 cell division protein FtsL [Paenibacillus oenotherae]
MAYVNGNLALQPKKKTSPQQTFRETKKVVVKRKSLPVQEKLLYMFTILVCVLVASVIIFRYAQIYEINADVRKLTVEYEKMAIEMKELQIQVEKLKSPDRITEQARKTGMIDNDQDPIKVRTGDNVNETAMKE